MKAISIRQPWAWLIVHGHKDIENRTWRTKHRGPILIHASKTVDWEAVELVREILAEEGIDFPDDDALETGGIVGQAKILDCVSESDSEWFDGPYGFVIGPAEPMLFIPCQGRPGVFDL
jgi:hypothetical protein